MSKRLIIQTILLLIIFHCVWGQSSHKKVKEKMWENNYKGFKLTQVPEKWKNESSVILCRSYDYEIRKEVFLTYLYENQYLRKRVKLQDNAAIEKYSEFNFDAGKQGDRDVFGLKAGTSKEVYVGIKIVKPSGVEIEIDISDAVVKQIADNKFSQEEKSIAIPGLEIGDIVDYYHCEKIIHMSNYFTRNKPMEFFLVEDEPIVTQRINLGVMRKCFINAKSLNGAPNLKLLTNNKEGGMRYYAEDKDRDAVNIDNKRWVVRRKELPLIKFETYFDYGKIAYAKRNILLGNPRELKSELTKDDLLFYMDAITHWESGIMRATDGVPDNDAFYPIIYYIKRTYHNTNDPITIAKEAYYYFRQHEYRKKFESNIINNNDGLYKVYDWYFVRNMSRLFEKLKIKHDILISSPRDKCKLEDMLLSGDIVPFIRINGEKPLFLCNFDRYTHYNDIPAILQGNQAYCIKFTPKEREREIVLLKNEIPVLPAKNSTMVSQLKVSFSQTNILELDIDRKDIITGLLKTEYQNSLITPYEYIEDSRNKKYETSMLLDNQYLRKKNKAELTEKIKIKKEQDIELQKERAEIIIKSDFNLDNDITLNSFKLLQTGMWDDKPKFECEYEFKVNSFTKKVGNNYLVSIGKLIGGQINVTDEPKVRNFDIYQPYARTIKNVIEFKIPEGYIVKGLDKLNFKKDSEFCSFTSTTKKEKDKFVLVTEKIYKTNFIKASNWESLQLVLNSAFDFTNQKILFEKI